MKHEIKKNEEAKELVPAPPLQHQPSQALAADRVIPKLLLMQGLSKLVDERKAQVGDIVRSTTAEKLGDDKTRVEIIPLAIRNIWMIQERDPAGGLKFRGYEQRLPNQEGLPWDYEVNGKMYKRTKVIELIGLLPKDIDAYEAEIAHARKTGEIPDLDKVIYPIAMRFQVKSYRAGQDVATVFDKAANLSLQMGMFVPPYSKTIYLSCKKEKNDKGTFFVYTVDTQGKRTDSKYLAIAGKAYEGIMASLQTMRIDETEEGEEAGDFSKF